MVAADRVFESSSLDSCQSSSSFTASLFQIAFTPNNKTLTLNVAGDSSVTGNVTFKVEATAYGYIFLRESLDPCAMGLTAICPLSQVQIGFDDTFNNISLAVIDVIPSVAYGIPDLDATVTVYMYATSNPTISLACVRSRISNRKTVNQSGVKWGTAVVAGLGLAASALVSGTYQHCRTYIALCLITLQLLSSCCYHRTVRSSSPTTRFVTGPRFQLVIWDYQGHLSPRNGVVVSDSTGGTPATILATLATKSVQVAKRNVESSQFLEETHSLYPRAQIDTTSSGEYIVSGLDRVAFRADMEPTNLILTGLTFYCIFVVLALLGLTLSKSLCELALRRKWTKSQDRRLQTFRENWLVTLKGVIFRLILLGCPLMTILCLWEFTQDDYPAEIILAIIFLFSMSAVLALAAFKII